MRRLSEKTCRLLQQLHNDPSFWEKLTGLRGVRLSLFAEIASEGEPLAIPHLTAFLVDGREPVREAAAKTIGRLISIVKPTEFGQLDEACRDDWAYPATSSGWSTLKPREVKQFCHLPSSSAVIGVTSFHASGFVRAAAVNELARITDGSELPFILVRLNDWVEVVQESAATAILQKMKPEYAPYFLKYFHLVSRLRSCKRNKLEILVGRVTTLLQEPGFAPTFREAILSGDRWLRRELFQIAIAKTSEHGTGLLQEILKDEDPILRLLAARNLIAHLEDRQLLPILLDLARDRFVMIRQVVLNTLAQRFPDASHDVLHTALLDGTASIRATARYWIGRQGPLCDFADIYRRSLDDPLPKRQSAAILGLGETGQVSDAKSLVTKLHAPALSIQKAAIRAIATLDGDHHVELFLTALTSLQAGVSNEAARALAKRTNTISDLLLRVFDDPAPAHVRMNFFKLILKQPFWSRGIFLFKALLDQDDHIVEAARHSLQKWLAMSRNIGTPPSQKEVQQLSSTIKASKSKLSADEYREVEFLLQSRQ